MSGGAICAICYEDARPIVEDLQSISACGHVFHELCLQQWMEYCPASRKPTCPLCKQSCTAHDVHRLYFQSAGSDSTQPQSSPSRNLQTAVDDPKQVNNPPALRKLEGQLAAAKTAIQSRNEQLKELDSQVVANMRRAEKAEAANVVARRELVQCKQSLTRVQEELKCCSNERAMLQEKNQAMSKDLAAHKLMGDTDLGEEEILRLANLGNGSNKNAVIETLTKSLILRNKSYKELMARCNELGMGESRALRKSEKTTEHLKKMKARLQELEKLLEEKDNACLRGLSRGYSKSQGEDGPSAHQADWTGINAPRNIASQHGRVPESMFKLPGFRQDLDVMPRAELPELQLPNIVKERGQMGIEPTCRKNVNTLEENVSSRKRGRSEEGATGLDVREEKAATNTSFSIWRIKSQHLLQKIEVLNRSKPPFDCEVGTRENRPVAPSGVVQRSFPRPGQTTRLMEDGSSAVTSGNDQPVLNPPGIEHGVGREISTMPQSCGPGKSTIVPPVNSYGGFAKMAPSDRLSTPSSTFIVSGADGRGGRVTVFKPPSLSLGAMAMSASRKVKRPKMSGAGFNGRQSSLQIEHFFGRTTTKS